MATDPVMQLVLCCVALGLRGMSPITVSAQICILTATIFQHLTIKDLQEGTIMYLQEGFRIPQVSGVLKTSPLNIVGITSLSFGGRRGVLQKSREENARTLP